MTLKNVEHIQHLMNSLTRVPESAEKDFIKLGSFLQSIHTNISDLVNQTDGSATLLQGDDENVLDSMTRIADSTMESLEQIHHMINDSIQPIIEIINQLNGLYDIQEDIKHISRYLNAVAFNFVVETSGSHMKDERFSILSGEVKKLAEQIHGISSRIKQDTESAHSRFSDAKSMISMRLTELEKLTAEAKNHIQDSIGETRELMEFSVSAIEQSNSSSVLINSQIGNIIVAMQMHDNISQRIEHIKQGLEDVRTLCSTQEPIGQRDYSGEERAGIAYHILLVQVSQLEEIISDIGAVFTENSQAFEKIVEEIDSFLKNLFSVKGKDADFDFTTGLKDSLGRINTLKNQGASMISEVERIASGSLETSEQLADYSRQLHTISQESQIKALNAIIAAEKLREHGRALKVLAREMRVMTERIDGFTNHVNQIIESITKTSKDLNSSSSAIKTEEEEELSQTIEHSISDISRTYDMVNSNMGDIREKGGQIKTMTCQVVGELVFLETMIDDLQGLLIGVKELKKEFEPFQHAFSGSLANDPYFSERYTMEKERRIHKEGLGEKEESSVETVSGEDDGLGDNIDLF